MEKIENFGIGILFIGIGIIIAILMVVWLLYNIFISSKGWASLELSQVPTMTI